MQAIPAAVDADELRPLKDVAEALGIPYPTATGWAKRGVFGHRLQVHRHGRKLYCRPSWFVAFIEKLNRM